ncbi:MAG TPA: hypothetical protein VF180_07950, partial [Acidimicrobiia bacterium]
GFVSGPRTLSSGCPISLGGGSWPKDERARHELFLRLEQALGPESVETLMELLPPVGWADVATKRDLDALRHQLLADFRGELLAQSNAVNARIDAINGQMKTLIFANFGAVVSMAALAFGVAKLT